MTFNNNLFVLDIYSLLYVRVSLSGELVSNTLQYSTRRGSAYQDYHSDSYYGRSRTEDRRRKALLVTVVGPAATVYLSPNSRPLLSPLTGRGLMSTWAILPPCHVLGGAAPNVMRHSIQHILISLLHLEQNEEELIVN